MFQSGISFGVRRGFSWKILIDQVILNLHEQEIITELRSKWFSEICQPQFFVTAKTPLTVVWFSGLVFVLVMSIFATLVMLIPENWYFRYFRQVVFRFYFKYVLQTKRYSVSKDCDEKSTELYDSYNLWSYANKFWTRKLFRENCHEKCESSFWTSRSILQKNEAFY